MRSMRLTLCAGAMAAAAFTPAAYASEASPADAGPAGVSVNPVSPSAGSDVRLRAEGCAGRTGTAASDAFVSDVRLAGAGGGGLVGDTRVRTALRPGSYGVRVDCDGHHDRVRGTVTVPAPHSSPSVAAFASPVAPVNAGGGGTARLAAAHDAHAAGPGTRQAVVGLVLAGAAAVAVAIRSARRGDDGRD
ncbi:hypothetical protein [Streptomyces aureus]|uniref:hypothetical protein n=1 Tax=Streptomyces aureus TaxID=193461 RepID=UPI000562D46B|nr:hypothetical protein [Streptomyces aureus]